MKYSLGLDIGTASVGWAVLNEDKKRIEDLGVRIFEIPENPKNGESLAKPRRDARSARRRLRRRRQRLNSLKNFFIEHNLLTREEIDKLLSPESRHNPYELRKKALEQKLPNDELFIALYHIAKRRGYKSNRRKVEESSKDTGKVLTAIKANEELLDKYKQVAVALLEADKFRAHKRNKLDSYDNSFIREDFEREIIAILKTQKWSDEWIEELIYQAPNGLFYQRPFMTKELIEKMRGKCPLEKNEPRAQKASYSFEMFRLAQDLAHITYNDGGKLTEEEINAAIEKAKTTASVKYKALREAIGHKNDSNFRFDYIRGKHEDDYADMEKHEFCNLKFYHAVKKACEKAGIDFAIIEDNIDLFDNIGYVLTVWKDDENIEQGLRELGLDEALIQQLMSLSFSGFAGHSLKALRKLTPHLLAGETYDKAVEAEYPGEFTEKLSGDNNQLPPLSEEQQNQITNPVVKRAISQTRLVVNAIIRKYGAPTQIKIECTNQLAKNFQDRMKIKKRQDENAEYNAKIVEILKELGITSPTGTQITKYKLREQQLCKCAYCGKPLGEETLTDDNLVDIDHIIPFSRCGNDGLNNKVVVCAECNREKTNLTPFEKWGNNPERWGRIIEITEASNMPNAKKQRILTERVPKEEWNKRALNDTRYIMKFMSQYIKSNLKFAEGTRGKQKVVLPTGFITDYLRKMYHIGAKNRDLNNCHHAVDACIIASVSQDQIRKIAELNKWGELDADKKEVTINDEFGEPIESMSPREYKELKDDILPWPRFDEEVIKRSGMNYDIQKIEKLTDFRDKFRDFDTYDEEFVEKIHPLFVSRKPRRGIKGAAHKETIRSPKSTDDGRRLTRKRLSECTLNDIENSVLPESDKALYEQLRQLWADKGKDAFAEPVYKNNKKVDKNGNPISPVHTIKVYSKEPSGILINRGTQFVNNGKTVCLKIYKRDGRFYAAPVYVHALSASAWKILPTPKGRNKAEKEELNKIRDKDGDIFATPENGFELVATVFPNDYIRVKYASDLIEGYYASYDITNGILRLVPHNQSAKGSYEKVALGSAIDVQRLDISVLGDNYLEA